MIRTILFTFAGLASAIRMDGADITIRVNELSGQEHLIECDANSTLQDLRSRVAAAADCSPARIKLYTEHGGEELTNLDGTLCENGVVDNTELDMIIQSWTDVIDEFRKSLNRSELAVFRHSPWDLACGFGEVDVVEALIAQGESIGPHATSDAVNSIRWSEEKSMKILRLLLDNGAEPSKRVVENAVRGKHEEALQLLLDRDPSLVKTAFDWTRRFNKPETTEWLIEQGYEDPTILVN